MELVEYFPALNRVEKPLVSVCIAHYKDTALVSACIDSVLDQDFSFDVEIIVHDDASPDNSVAFLREKYPQVELISGLANVGFCTSNNRMVSRARGQYVLLLNNDAALHADALSTLLAVAEQQNPRGILTLPQYDWTNGQLVDKGCLLDLFYNPVPNTDESRTNVAMVIGACLWIERTKWQQLGGFPEWIQSIGEDLYICCLARLSGISVDSTLTSGYRHRQGHSFGGNKPQDGTLQSTLQRRRLSERNKTYALFTMTPTALMWPLLAAHLALLTIEGVLLSAFRMNFRIFTAIYLNVFFALASNRSLLMEMRAQCQAKRKIGFIDYFRSFQLLPQKFRMLRRYGIPKISGDSHK